MNPYLNQWCIKVRCVRKDDNTSYSNGDGCRFSADMVDKDGSQVGVVAFNKACKKFWPMLTVGNVYTLSNAHVNTAHKSFAHIPNDYAITLKYHSTITRVEDDANIPGMQYSFVSIENIDKTNIGETVDVCAIVMKVHQLVEIQSKKIGKLLKKRTLLLYDDSKRSVELTLWGKMAEKYNEQSLQHHSVIAIKATKVSSFGGRSLSGAVSVHIQPPDEPAVIKLYKWWQKIENKKDVKPLTISFSTRYV